MSLYNSLARDQNLGELNFPLFTGSPVPMTPAARKAAARKNLGLGTALTIAALTDNSGGTADNTVAAVPAATAATTDTSAASLASTNTALTAIKNDIADLTAKVNALITGLTT